MRYVPKLIIIVAGFGAVFLNKGLAMSHDQVTTDTIVIACPDVVRFQAELCESLETVIRSVAPEKLIRLGTDANGTNELAVSLRVPRMSENQLQAYLEWSLQGGMVEQGPKGELSVMDATLKPAMFDRFLKDLLDASPLPIK